MAKIAISLPEQLLREIERERGTCGVTRSEFLRRAVEQYLRRQREREDVEQYIRGYLEHPETEEELGWVEVVSQEVLAEYPWDDEDDHEDK